MIPAEAPAARSLLDSMPNPVLVVAEDDRICFANSAAEDFFQTGHAVLARSTLAHVVPFSSPVLQAVKAVREGGGTMNEYAIAIGTPRTGAPRNVDLQVTQVQDDPRFVLLILLERSMAHKIDRQLTHRSAARSVTGMAAMLAHEIKNPLAGIRGAAQLIEPALTGDDRGLARLICEETDRIRALVDQMEVFSDERPLDMRPVNIHVVLDHVKALTQAGLDRQMNFREDYDPSLPPVLGNRDQLIQVFVNLLKNAVEAIDADGRHGEIQLTTAFRPGVRLTIPGTSERVSLPLEVCVHDNGAGVSDDVRPHLFDPFVTTKPSGKGLGLALVAKIIGSHGGIVECVARETGTTFRILLPMIRTGSDGLPAVDEDVL